MIKNNQPPSPSPGGQVVVYDTPDGAVHVDVRLEQETVWLTQRQMAAVFATSPENVLMHLRNVFAQDELAEDATTKDFLVVQSEGQRQVRRSLSLLTRTLKNQALVDDTGQAVWERTSAAIAHTAGKNHAVDR